MLFCFNCEKCRHLEIEFHEGNEREKLIEKEDNLLVVWLSLHQNPQVNGKLTTTIFQVSMTGY
jgi:hypothetical protein